MTARHPFADAIEALHPWAQRVNAAIVEGLLDLNRRLEEARTMPTATAPQDLTAVRYADTLAELVAIVEQFGPFTDWTITAGHSRRAAVRWSRLELRVAERSDLALAEFIAAERVRARQDLRRTVVRVATDLGLNPGPFRQPATIRVNAGLTRCPACSCNVRAGGHRPGSEECRLDREERLISISS